MRFLSFLVFLSLTFPLSAQIRIVGTDLLGEKLSAELNRFADANEYPLTLSLEGSSSGLSLLRTGQADLGFIILAPGEAPPGPDYRIVPIAYQTAVVIAREAIPIAQLSYPQLAGIYGASEQTNFRRWGDLGVTGPWAQRTILAAALNRPASLSFDLVRHHALRNPQIKPTVLFFDDPGIATLRIAGDEGGIAIVSTPPARMDGLKILLVSRTGLDVAYGPTPDNLHNGDYPLRLPINLIFRTTDTARLNFLLRHLLSEEMIDVWNQSGVVPLPIQARNQIAFDLETS